MSASQYSLQIFEEQEFITPPELAEIIRTDTATIRRWCKDQVLKAIDTRAVGAKRPRWKISRTAWENFARMRAGVSPVGHRKRRSKAADLSEYFDEEQLQEA